MHTACANYVIKIKSLFPFYFKLRRVLEVGSQNINGSVRPLFHRCLYIGIDVGPGDGVDVVASGHAYKPVGLFDTIISTECAEHDEHWKETMMNCMRLLKPGGAMIFTCAGEGRPEHGTRRTDTFSSPFTTDYYQNVTPEMIIDVEGFKETWSYIKFEIDAVAHDTRFFAIKRGIHVVFQPSLKTLIYNHLLFFYNRRIRDFKAAFKKYIKHD